MKLITVHSISDCRSNAGIWRCLRCTGKALQQWVEGPGPNHTLNLPHSIHYTGTCTCTCTCNIHVQCTIFVKRHVHYMYVHVETRHGQNSFTGGSQVLDGTLGKSDSKLAYIIKSRCVIIMEGCTHVQSYKYMYVLYYSSSQSHPSTALSTLHTFNA